MQSKQPLLWPRGTWVLLFGCPDHVTGCTFVSSLGPLRAEAASYSLLYLWVFFFLQEPDFAFCGCGISLMNQAALESLAKDLTTEIVL